MAKLIKRGDRLFIELPESLKDKKIKAIKLEPEIFVIASEGAIKRLIERQMHYLLSRRIRNRLVGERREEKREEKRGRWEEDYAVITSEEAARAFSREHAWEFKRGELLGVKGFDGKYYVVRASTYAEVLENLREALGSEGATPKEAAERLKLPEDLVKAVLEVAKEEGVVYEVKGGRYRYAG
ncbi:TPA: hypothetical protein EYP13_03740 [Candidatus Micrarchaeota archaeon]|nr:hypothetical protein [Candidatus Micrarchaeota archaeon]